jgi:NAD(P)H-dependent FMN reductase
MTARNQDVFMPRILLFPGSLRRQSYQLRLAGYLAELIGHRVDIDLLLAHEVDLPLFNQDLEHDPEILKKLVHLHQRFSAAQGIIVVSPEYNGHVAPYLKNTVDWISRLPRIDSTFSSEHAFYGKAVLLSSATTGASGGHLGLRDARTIFSYLGCLVCPEQICIPYIENHLKEQQLHFDTPLAHYIQTVVANFIALINKLGDHLDA